MKKEDAKKEFRLFDEKETEIMIKEKAKKDFRLFDEKEREVMIRTHIGILGTIKEVGINTFEEVITMITKNGVLLNKLHKEILEEDKNNIEK